MKLTNHLLGEVEIMDTETARGNYETLLKHVSAELVCDIETTMSTMGPDTSWAHHGMGVKIQGYEAVKANYLKRFRSEVAPLTVNIRQTLVGDTAAVVELDGPMGPDGPVAEVVWFAFSNGKLSEAVFTRQLSEAELTSFREVWGYDTDPPEKSAQSTGGTSL